MFILLCIETFNFSGFKLILINKMLFLSKLRQAANLTTSRSDHMQKVDSTLVSLVSTMNDPPKN